MYVSLVTDRWSKSISADHTPAVIESFLPVTQTISSGSAIFAAAAVSVYFVFKQFSLLIDEFLCI